MGVMVYEAVVGHMALISLTIVRGCALGTRSYPWELPADQLEPAWRKSRLRGMVAACLSRDPAERPTAAALAASVSKVGHVTTMRG